MKDTHHPKKSLVYLAGFMGSGKSTIGPILANTLGYEFVDIDKHVEQRAGNKIKEIFATEGEEAFRNIERASLLDVCARKHCVVSLGGGTIANEENFQLIQKSGVIVYLQLSPEEITQRVHHRTDRPLLVAPDGSKLPPKEIQVRVGTLLAKREKFYSRADIIIRADRKRVGATVDEVVRRLRGFIEI